MNKKKNNDKFLDDKSSNNKIKEKKLLDLTSKFNMVIIGMVNHIVDYYEDSNVTKVKMFLINIIDDNPDELISYFLLHIYKNDEYRKNILEQNDKFFMEQSYEEYTEGNKDKLAELFKFKNLWTKINGDSQEYIKKAMMTLVKICQQYILNL
jgi:hypothetical protein